jgi:hypothetical protein
MKNIPFVVETVDATCGTHYMPFTSLLDAYKMVNNCLELKDCDSIAVYKDGVPNKDEVTGTLLERYVLDKEADSYMIMGK